jgi:hypothetical protein
MGKTAHGRVNTLFCCSHRDPSRWHGGGWTIPDSPQLRVLSGQFARHGPFLPRQPSWIRKPRMSLELQSPEGLTGIGHDARPRHGRGGNAWVDKHREGRMSGASGRGRSLLCASRIFALPQPGQPSSGATSQAPPQGALRREPRACCRSWRCRRATCPRDRRNSGRNPNRA